MLEGLNPPNAPPRQAQPQGPTLNLPLQTLGGTLRTPSTPAEPATAGCDLKNVLY